MTSQGLASGEKADMEEEKQETAEASQGKRQPWCTLQKSFRHVVEKMRSEEMKVVHLSHGLQHLCRVAFASPVRHVAHHSPKRSFVVLDAESTLHLLREDGSLVRSVAAPAPMAGLLYAAQVDRFVGWDTEGLRVLDSSFQLLSQVPSHFPIRCGLYSEQLNRIVTAGDGNLTLWSFRYGFRSLQCHTAVSEGLEPSVVFTHLALGADSPESQSCFAICDRGAAAFDIAKGRLLSFKKDLHSRVITGLAYCHVTGCVVTASRDTTIKVWDKNWNIQTVFVGHTAPVIAVTTYPDRPLVFSASQDGTIRTWNLETIDQVDQVHVLDPVEALETKTASHVISISGSSLNLWKINKLYSLYSPVGSPVKRLSCSNLEALGNFPLRLLCVGQDSTVRLLEAQSGLTLSTFSLDQPSQVQEAAYCLPRETVFVLTEPGSLLRINAAADPMVLRKSTPSCSPEAKPCCLLLYSHVVDPEAAYATWCEVAQNKSYRKQWQRPPLQRQEKNRYLPVLGHKNGFLSVVEWFSGRTQYEVEAHGSGRITALAEYPAQTCVISAGSDLTVKMWRLFPYAEECLVPLLCFSCTCLATHLCSLGETLAVAFQDPQTITHRIVYYSLMEQTCYEHKPEDDAEDEITGLCCCPNLKLFASASRDGSVKVWDIQNKLLRHLKLNTIPESLAFANRWGDLLVGIERHLYLIHHNKYLPNYYRMKFLCTKFLEPLKDVPLPPSNSCFEALVKENVRRLLHEPPLEEAESPLPGAQRQETTAPRDSQAPSKGLSGLAERNRDLLLLQTGRMSPAKKGRVTQEMKEEAFERYLRIFYKEQPKMEIPKEDPFDADEVLEALRHVDSVAKLYGPARSNMFLGCFPRPSVLKPAEQTPPEASPPAESSSRLPSTSAPSLGRIPLAATLEALVQFSRGKKDRKEEEAAPLEKEQAPSLKGPAPSPRAASPSTQALKPPLMPSGSPQAITAVGPREGRHKGRRKKSDKGLGVVHEPDTATPGFLPSSYVSSAPGSVAETIQREKSISFKESSSVVQRQASHKRSTSPSSRPRSQTSTIVKGFFPERRPESQEWSRSQIRRALGSRQSVPLPGISSGYIPNSVVAQQLHVWDRPEEEEEEEYRQERLVEVTGPQEELESLSRISSTWVMGSEESEESPIWGPSGAKSAGGSQSPVKESPPAVFLTQLDASQYPEKELMPPSFILPLVDMEWFQKMFPEGFPPETTLQEFLAMLLGNVVTADFNTKTELVAVVVALKEQLKDRMRQTVYKTLLHVLNMKEGSPSMQERSQRKFILASLRALMDINKDSKELMVELVTYYVMAPPSFRAAVKDLIQDVGVQDPHDYFYKELESWPVGEQETKESVRRRSKQWLDGAMQELQEFRRRFLGQEVLPEQKALSESSLTESRSTESPLWEQMSPEEDEDNFEEQPEWKYSSVSFDEEQRDAAVGQEGAPPEAKKAFYRHQKKAEKEEMRDDLGLEEQEAGRVPARRDQEEPLGDEPVGEGEQPERKRSMKRAQKRTDVTQPRLRSVHPVDAIHYFTEKQLEREMEEMKRVVSAALDTPRDTVMVLPPIRKKRAILRLGETNAMWRKRLPERFYFPYIFPRYLMKGFVPFVKLPLPKINLDVFPAPSERPLSPKTFSALQQSVHKYFIPKFSYADSYP